MSIRVPSPSVDLATNLTEAHSLITQLQKENQETSSKLATAQETHSKEIEQLSQQLSAQQHTVEDLKRRVKRTAAREEYYRNKVAKLTEEKTDMLPGTATPSQTCNVKSHQALREKLEKCKKENADLHSSVHWMEYLLNDDTDTMT